MIPGPLVNGRRSVSRSELSGLLMMRPVRRQLMAWRCRRLLILKRYVRTVRSVCSRLMLNIIAQPACIAHSCSPLYQCEACMLCFERQTAGCGGGGKRPSSPSPPPIHSPPRLVTGSPSSGVSDFFITRRGGGHQRIRRRVGGGGMVCLLACPARWRV